MQQCRVGEGRCGVLCRMGRVLASQVCGAGSVALSVACLIFIAVKVT